MKQIYIIIGLIATAVLCIGYASTLWIIDVDSETWGDYYEYDPSNKIVASDGTITHTDVLRADEFWLYKDFGPNHFEDYEIHLKVRVDEIGQHAITGLLLLTNDENINSISDANAANHGQAFYVYHWTGNEENSIVRFIFKDYSYTGGEVPNDRIIDYSPSHDNSDIIGKDIYITLTRTGLELGLYVYEDEARTNLIHEDHMTVTEDTHYRYAFTAYSYDLNGDTRPVVCSATTSDYYFETPSEYIPPVAMFDWSPTFPTAGQQINFDATETVEQPGYTYSYGWDWDNNGVIDTFGKTQTHTFTTSGDKTVSLTVDDGISTHSISHEITVSNAPPTHYTLTVYTKDSNGAILPEATVVVDGQQSISSSTGEIQFDLLSGGYTVSVNKEGYNNWQGGVNIPTDSTITSANTIIPVEPDVTCWKCIEGVPESETFPPNTVCGATTGPAAYYPFSTIPDCDNTPVICWACGDDGPVNQEFPHGEDCPTGWSTTEPDCTPTTPGFELFAIIGALGIALIIFGRKRK